MTKNKERGVERKEKPEEGGVAGQGRREGEKEEKKRKGKEEVRIMFVLSPLICLCACV